MMSSAPLHILSSKDLTGVTNAYPNTSSTATTDTHGYPSPSLSPVASFRANTEGAPASFNGHRSTPVKRLIFSTHSPASPLDALVLALEATAGQMKDYRDHDRDHSHPARPSESFQDHDSDEDPNATVPSSPTLFMKKTPTGGNDVVPSLHQLPNLVLPEALYSPKPSLPLLASFPAATSGVSLGPSSANLTPSTRPGQTRTQRKTSVSSQGSIDSTSSANSNKERQKTVVCSVASCDKKFYEVAHLRIHERSHTGTRPFVCRFESCERSFTQLGNLKTHERKHTGERPFKCPHPGCDKSFTQLGNLKTHERIHDEVKPFMCRLAGCGKTFSQLGNLKTHTAKMHPDVNISDEDLAIRTASSPVHTAADRVGYSRRGSQAQSRTAGQVAAHFNPYQRRPIRPQRSERALLIKDIRAMVHHQERARRQDDEENEHSSSEDMDE